MLQFSVASAFLSQQFSDKMMHCKRNTEALTVNVVCWYLNKSQGLGAPGKNNVMVGQHKLSLLARVCLNFF
jgi:hypothetical protein